MNMRTKASRKKEPLPGRKKGRSLASLGGLQILREVRTRPHRITELMFMLEQDTQLIRGKAALAIARLADVHPESLLRHLDRLREGLRDESAYVRWTLAAALGRLGSIRPGKIARCLPELALTIDDENSVVRAMGCAALARIGTANPEIVRAHFESSKREIPPAVARSLSAGRRSLPKTGQTR